ncbi:carboxypeptidase regulatory-like domain-containing protein, partial [Candidatus Falkowbacteria bacterium]|nr:carboxypeptidase regulatory-like domain-containing protein [Candidatus Falkowbacteria bacterium]
MKERHKKLIETLQRVKQNLVFALFITVFTATGLYFAYQNFLPALAVGTFSDDFTTIGAMDSIANEGWLGTSAGSTLVDRTDVQLQGTGSIGTYNATNAAENNIGMKRSVANLNLQDKQVWFYFYSSSANTQGDIRNLMSNMRVMFCDGAVGAAGSICGGNNAVWQYCSTQPICKSKLNFGWTSIKFFTTQPTTQSGSPNLANITSLALMFDISSKLSEKSTGTSGQGWDFLRAGTKINFTGGSLSNPVTFTDVKAYSDSRVLGAIDVVAGSFVNLYTSLEIGSSTAPTATFFQDKNKFIFMNMINSDDKIRFILQPQSTTTFGAFENNFAISGNTVAYSAATSTSGELRSTPFIFPSSQTPLPELYLYASAIKKPDDVFFGTSTAAAIGQGQIFDTEIDNASTTYIYSPALQLKNVDIHHSTTTAASTVKIFVTPTTPYENVRIFASPANGLDIATTTDGPDQITLWNIAFSNNAGYDIRIENPYVVNMVNSSFVNASTTYLNINRGWALNKQYTFNVAVKDSQGAPINGATVKLWDKNMGDPVVNVNTGSDGKISQQIITAYRITHATSSSAVNADDLNNFSLEVTASGKTKVTQTLTVNSAQDLNIAMAGECDATGSDFAYPMRVATTSNPAVSSAVITIWGAKAGDGGCGIYGNLTCTQTMGMSTSTAITFNQIFQFAEAANNKCAMQSPSTGSFWVRGILNIGSTTASTTYVKTASESVDFGKQVRVYASSTLISGQMTATGSPYA